MSDDSLVIEAFDSRVKRREERREFFKSMTGVAAMAGGLGLLSSQAAAQTAPTDNDILNFALNLEYLEAQFYTFATTGSGLPNSLLTGTGTQGAATGGRQVIFTDPVVGQYAREIAADERAHVNFIRTTLGSAAVAQPAIDVGVAPSGAFSSAARAAGLVGPGQSFDAYANDENFLLAAFIFEDVGVTGFKGAAPLLTSKPILEATAGILAVEAYHAALIRTTLFRKGMQAPALIEATERISDARDSLDGPLDLDQGIQPREGGSNIFPSDGNALAFSRSAGQVLNIVYLNPKAVDRGGFFPNGTNGTIRISAAN